MSLPRARIDEPLTDQARCRVPEDVAHHLTTVLRLRAGASVQVFDGSGRQADAELQHDGGAWWVQLGSVSAIPPRARLTLCYGLAKGEKVDQVIRQATELGVARIVLVQCERSVVRLSGDRAAKRLERWARVAAAASRQSGRAQVPEISGPVSFSGALDVTETHQRVLFDLGGPDGLDALSDAGGVAVFVGPEGGFSDSERQSFKDRAGRVVGLATPVLRSETAAIVACAVTLGAIGELWPTGRP